MTVRVHARPGILEWARDRCGVGEDVLAKRFPELDEWIAQESVPTLKQLKDFAERTYTPLGYMFLEEPPVEDVPVPDFRTVGDRPLRRAVSVDLLDTLYVNQARQEWYRENRLLGAEPPLEFVGSVTTAAPTDEIAAAMRTTLDWTSETRRGLPSWEVALTRLRENAEAAGVLVVISGIVGSNTHRTLDPEEFRGFALVDPHAALVFVNGADSKAAQVFTLAHELAHVWLGSTGLSDVAPESAGRFGAERWCNEVAAELLVPMDEFVAVFDAAGDLRAQLQPLARHFRVSTMVILGRAHEAGALDWERFMSELHAERRRIAGVVAQKSGGGNYYTTKAVQVGKRFAKELIADTLEGRTTYTEAFRLLEINKTSVFDELSRRLGVL